MMRTQTHSAAPNELPDGPRVRSLKELAVAEEECRRCPLYRDATQAVPGEGKARARVMLVGEQPGNDEDRAGHPFIGPAGKLLDRALAEAGVPRKSLFVTNAVKHFKYEPRGKRRLHKRPNNYEIERCKWWNNLERLLVKPKLVVAMGSSAVRSLTGKSQTITSLRGKLLPFEEGRQLLVTVHPSALLRIPDPDDRQAAFENFVSDLKRCRPFVA